MIPDRKGGKMEENNKAMDEILQEDKLEETTEEIVEEDELKEAKEEIAEEKQQDKAAEYLDRLQRLMAEFDNYRKRSEKEKQGMYDLGVSETVTELLSVVDNFERALKQDCQDETFYKGVNMIYKQLVNMLENLEVMAIEAEGQVFDPSLHNAVLHVEDENVGDNVIVEELQKGYLYKEKVIRHSMVKVAN